MRAVFFARVLVAPLIVWCLSFAALRAEIALNGGFKPGPDGWLPDWERPAAGQAALRVEEGRDVLTLESAGPEASTVVGRDLELDPRWRQIEVAGDFRYRDIKPGKEPWQEGRVRLRFFAANGARLGPEEAVQRFRGKGGWYRISRAIAIPPGAGRLRLDVGLFNTLSGALDVRDLTVRARTAEDLAADETEARLRIERHRKADLRVLVTDAEGRALPGARVAVRMRRHAYPFGSAVRGDVLVGVRTDVHGEDLRRYHEAVARLFNMATLENDLKGPFIERRGIENAEGGADWLVRHGVRLRGHVLVWPSWRHSISSWKALAERPEELRGTVHEHIAGLAGRFRGRIAHWDVVNEPYTHHDLIELLGDAEMAAWFESARAADPEARLFLNENLVEFGGLKQDTMLRWARFLKEKGAPIDGLGWQSHMWTHNLPYGYNVLTDLDRFAPLELPVTITEFSLLGKVEPAEQARFMREYLTAWFSHPLTGGFLMWGFWDGAHFERKGPLFARDWTLKPAGRVFLDLVFKEWWTDEETRTDAGGAARVRGFLGDYVVEVIHDGRIRKLETTLPAEGAELALRWDAAAAEPFTPETRARGLNPYAEGWLP